MNGETFCLTPKTVDKGFADYIGIYKSHRKIHATIVNKTINLIKNHWVDEVYIGYPDELYEYHPGNINDTIKIQIKLYIVRKILNLKILEAIR